MATIEPPSSLFESDTQIERELNDRAGSPRPHTPEAAPRPYTSTIIDLSTPSSPPVRCRPSRRYRPLDPPRKSSTGTLSSAAVRLGAGPTAKPVESVEEVASALEALCSDDWKDIE